MMISIKYLRPCTWLTKPKRRERGIIVGVNPGILKGFKGYCWSGDIHVPQKVSKNIQYIGAPTHIRFGDSFILVIIAASE